MIKKMFFALRYFYHKIFSDFYYLGWRVIIERNVTIRGTNKISIGNHVNIDANAVIYAISHSKYKFKKPRLIIEDKVGIGIGAVVLAVNSVRIKEKAMIGPHTVLADYDHHYQNANLSIRDQGLNRIRPVVIEGGAWIGANTTVCSGVTVGKNSVIGANSVVTKDIPAYSVAVGSPAKVIKKYNDKTREWERIK